MWSADSPTTSKGLLLPKVCDNHVPDQVGVSSLPSQPEGSLGEHAVQAFPGHWLSRFWSAEEGVANRVELLSPCVDESLQLRIYKRSNEQGWTFTVLLASLVVIRSMLDQPPMG